MKYMTLFWMLAIIGCTALSQKPDGQPRTPANAYDNSEYNKPLAEIPKDQYLRFNDLKELLVSKRLTSIEETLPILNSKYPEYLNFHTLMYGSFSIQQSSFEEPRVLVFGPDARFIFSFNGNHNQMGGKSFETVEYSDQTHSFQFREITFKKYPGYDFDELNLQANEIAYQDDNIIVSKANPAKCLQCHGQNASPIWQTYFMWPGAYGSNDDQLSMSFDTSSWNPNNEGFFKSTNKPSSQGRRMSIKPGMRDAELDGLIRYATAKPKHTRYKWLPTKIVEIGVVEYAKGVPFSNLDYSAQSRREAERVKGNYEWPMRPNDFLLSALERLNQDRLLARLEKDGLKDAFASQAWEELFADTENLTSQNVIPVMARKIEKVISQFKFKGQKPSVQQIETLIRTNLRDEIEMQRERITRQEANLGKGSLQYQPYIAVGDNGTLSPETPRPFREGMEVIQNSQEFYTQLLSLKRFTELDKIAVGIETDNQFLNTAAGILLADRGIDLHDYNMNLRQTSLAFHTAGLDQALQYLGINRRNP